MNWMMNKFRNWKDKIKSFLNDGRIFYSLIILTVLYNIAAFIKWDLFWISDINEWLSIHRFAFVFVIAAVIFFNIIFNPKGKRVSW